MLAFVRRIDGAWSLVRGSRVEPSLKLRCHRGARRPSGRASPPMPPAYSSLTSAVTTYNPRWETFEEKRKREERELTEWNDSHSAELCVVFTSPPFYSLSHASVFFSLRSNPAKAKEKHKFTHGKGCAELNTDRFADAEKVSKKETSARYEASLTLYCLSARAFSGRERQLGGRLLHGGLRRRLGRRQDDHLGLSHARH